MYDTLLRITAAVVLALTSASSSADTLRLANGDRLTGSLINIRSGLLSFRTELAGRIFVPTEEVTGLDTREFMLVSLNNDVALPGKIVTQDDKFYVIAPGEDRKTELVLANVTNIESVPQSPAPAKPANTEKGLTVSMETGYQWREGNESNQGATAAINLDGNTEKLKIEGRVLAEMTEGEGFAEEFIDADLTVQSNTDRNLKPTLIVDVQRDTDQTVDLRSDIAVGAEKNLMDSEKQRLDGFVGVEASIEKYDPDALRKEQGLAPTAERSKNDEDVNLNLLLKYDRKMYRSSTLSKRLTLHPSLTNPSSLRAEFESALQVPLPLGMQLRLNLEVEYDDTLPYADLDDWNTRFGASVNFQF